MYVFLLYCCYLFKYFLQKYSLPPIYHLLLSFMKCVEIQGALRWQHSVRTFDCLLADQPPEFKLRPSKPYAEV